VRVTIALARAAMAADNDDEGRRLLESVAGTPNQLRSWQAARLLAAMDGRPRPQLGVLSTDLPADGLAMLDAWPARP
jgi:hypothetical protein